MVSTCRLLAMIWHATQVEMHGSHSPERVVELTRYANQTSWLRVVTILLATPLPGLVVTVLVDFLPLDNPSEGVNANTMYLLRSFYTFLVITFLLTHQFRLSVPALPYPLKQAITNTVLVSGLSVGISYGLGQCVGFPLPFSSILLAPAWTTLLLISLAIEWWEKIKTTPGSGTMLVNAIKLWLCEALLVFTYPAYYYIYTTLSKAGKTSFALLLPVIKLVMKNIIARSVIHLKDEMPEVVVFNVEVFNALFLSYCMLNSPSVWVTLEIMIFDGFMMAFALRDVGNARRCLKELERRIEHESSWDSFRNRGSLSSKSLSARLTTLDRAGLILLSNDIKPKTTSTRSSEAPNAILVSTSLRPAPCLAKSSVKVIAKSFDSIRRLSAERLFGRGRVHPEVNNGGSSPTRYSDKVQRLLYAVEFLLLMNYVEVIIPLVYSIYLYGMYHLPNRDYYVQLHGIDHDQLLRMINGVLFYCSLQLVSLFVLFFLLYCLLGLSPIHQLAFVLEKQFSGVQLKLVFWVYYNVQASLQHSGYDYSFKFAWLHRQNVDGEENDFRF